MYYRPPSGRARVSSRMWRREETRFDVAVSLVGLRSGPESVPLRGPSCGFPCVGPSGRPPSGRARVSSRMCRREETRFDVAVSLVGLRSGPESVPLRGPSCGLACVGEKLRPLSGRARVSSRMCRREVTRFDVTVSLVGLRNVPESVPLQIPVNNKLFA
jgi:hypothetical protein